MGFMTIDGKQVEFTDEPNVLLRSSEGADIDMPSDIMLSLGAFRIRRVPPLHGRK